MPVSRRLRFEILRRDGHACRYKNGGVWAYFCGCCWNEITDRQELARRLIEDDEA